MSREKKVDPQRDPLLKINAQANGIFKKLADTVENECKEGALEIDVVKVARQAGLELDAADLEELQVSRVVLVHPFIPWHIWFPWRPIWCWWWRRYHPWYRCCWWWWTRCSWYLR